MAQIRRELHEDVREVVASAEAVTDWPRYIRMYPCAALGAAVAAGYLIVPRRHRTVPRDIATHADVAQAREVVEDVKGKQDKPKKSRKGVVGAAFGFLVPIALRAAQGYAVQYLEQWVLQQQMAAGPHSPDQPEAPGGAGRPRGMAGF